MAQYANILDPELMFPHVCKLHNLAAAGTMLALAGVRREGWEGQTQLSQVLAA